MHAFIAVVDEMMMAIGLTKLSDIKANLWHFMCDQTVEPLSLLLEFANI